MWRKILIVGVFAAFSYGALLAEVEAADDDIALSRITTSVHRDVTTIGTALVIGNGRYRNEPLENAQDDARAMAGKLSALGFDVMHYENLSSSQMRAAVSRFHRHLTEGGTGLFYYSGHGVQLNGHAYLLPLDAKVHAPEPLRSSAIGLYEILEGMAPARARKLNIVVLDSCLNNPFDDPVDMRRVSKRLSDPAVSIDQTLVAYATIPGSPAIDGERNGMFTSRILDAMAFADTDIQALFQHIQTQVSAATGGRQQPHTTSTLTRPISLVGNAPSGRPLLAQKSAPESMSSRTRGVLPKDSAEQYELTFWESIKDSTHASDYEAYLQAYPNGRFAALARARIERIRAAAPKPDAVPDKPPAAKAAPERPRAPPAPKPQPQPEVARPAPAPPPAPKPADTQASDKPPAPAPTTSAGDVRDCPTCPVLVSIRTGAFTMGSAADDLSERPPHRVTINTPFAIGKYEVTVAQWDACVEAGACQRITAPDPRPKESPVRDVSWDDAQAYVKWLTKVSGKPYRLPSEAEWEFAIRGGTSTRYWWGDQMRPGNANCKDCGEPWQRDAPVNAGSYAANPYGLHDMNGSVWEWVSDCWHNSYKGAPTDARAWDEPNCRVRVIRGGSWREGASYMPSSTRFKYDASVRHSQNGFRVARDMP
ncbi:hypothetical protein D3871_22135 [Noviherbaspirillum saxi]|uniref:Caspase family p20 domain-containing protein n=1 Tax=Noviherbaspirillum saxi TaxID=2320863 RepID=A0A3A3FM21_9BURK|nr:SUMF1/EgtB/PvdO family nonheme iron enzyme [Noviherbaspirillum saxi]RJF96357.1 hypothetical protein D3871_22135 [Noviherbaspirillum saxi]